MTSTIWLEQDFGVILTANILQPEVVCFFAQSAPQKFPGVVDLSLYSSLGQRLLLCPGINKTLFLHFDLIRLHENWFVICDSLFGD